MTMQFPAIDQNNIYTGMIDAVPATPPDVGWYAPEGIKTAIIPPPTDELDKWRYDENNTWEELTEEWLYMREREAINQKYNGLPYGRVTIAKETLLAATLRGLTDNISFLQDQLETALADGEAEMQALEDKYNAYE